MILTEADRRLWQAYRDLSDRLDALNAELIKLRAERRSELDQLAAYMAIQRKSGKPAAKKRGAYPGRRTGKKRPGIAIPD